MVPEKFLCTRAAKTSAPVAPKRLRETAGTSEDSKQRRFPVPEGPDTGAQADASAALLQHIRKSPLPPPPDDTIYSSAKTLFPRNC